MTHIMSPKAHSKSVLYFSSISDIREFSLAALIRHYKELKNKLKYRAWEFVLFDRLRLNKNYD